MAEKLTQVEISKKIAKALDVTNKRAKEVYEAVCTIMHDALVEGKGFPVRFGILYPCSRSAKEGVNPRTKEKISIPERKFVKFKQTAAFKNELND